MMTKFTGIFYLLNGISMLVVWTVLILTNQVPELNSQLPYMLFHLTAEFITAVIAVLTGFGLLKNYDSNYDTFYPVSDFTKSRPALLFNGAQIYVMLNISGMLIDKAIGYTIGYTCVVIILITYSIWVCVKLLMAYNINQLTQKEIV
jgi:hypothetical protein